MIVIDDFVQDKRLLHLIANDPNFFKTGFHWWRGWWHNDSIQHDAPEAPTQLRLVDYIWRQHTPDAYCGIPAVGFEFWSGYYDADDPTHKVNEADSGAQENPVFSLNHHMDKDEWLWSNERKYAGPAVGTIFYPVEHNCEGGYLRIYDTHESDLSAPYEKIAPKFNRLIIFDATKLHAVEEVTAGVRKAIAINVWTQPLSEGQMSIMKGIY